MCTQCVLYASGTQTNACSDLSSPIWCCRFYQAEDWTAKKLECLVDPPDTLDLEGLRSKGAQPGEQMQPQEEEQAQPAGKQLLDCWDHHLVQREMGTTHEAAQPPDRQLMLVKTHCGIGDGSTHAIKTAQHVQVARTDISTLTLEDGKQGPEIAALPQGHPA